MFTLTLIFEEEWCISFPRIIGYCPSYEKKVVSWRQWNQVKWLIWDFLLNSHRNSQSRNQRGRQIRCHSCNIPIHCHHCDHRETSDRQGVTLLHRPDTPRPREDQPQLETEDKDTDNIEREIANSEPTPNLRDILEDFETEFDLYQNILEPMDIE